MTKFRNKNGDLNAYALACGYVQKDDKTTVELTKEGCYHIKFYNEKRNIHLWETSDKLGYARILYKRMITKVKNERLLNE